MPLTLTVTSHKGVPPSKSNSISIEHESISIGRQKGNSLVLNDPECVVSGKHAEIEYRNDDYYITDTSTNNTLIDQSDKQVSKRQTLRDGQSAKLNNNDLLTFGDYEIQVSITSQHNQAASDDLSYRDGYENSESLLKNDHKLDSGSDDPFAVIVTATEENENLLNQEVQNYNAISDFSFLDSIGDSDQMSVDEGLPNPDATDLFADIEPAIEDKKKPLKKHNTATTPPQKPAQQPPSISNTEVDPEHIMNFLKGAGIASSSITSTINADTFYLIGQLLSRSLQGAIQVLWARSKIKSELGMEVTIVHRRGNNPLKFSPSAQESLVKMLDPQGKGYMPANEAIDEAFSDIGAHEMAVMAGMRSALNDVLKRFNPEYLEQRLQKKSPVSVKIPIHKQAMLWDLFQDLYDEIEKEAQDDFGRLFGRAFAEAYDDHLRKIET
jgi:type VI secretion system protein